MPDQLTTAGLQVMTTQEILDELLAGLQIIYGSDINVDQNSPDGQWANIIAQAGTDLREILVSLYNSFAVNSAFGVLLDQRVALNGITRHAGTFTFTDIEVVVDRAITLPGLDAAINDVDGTGYTVADNAGNQFILAATEVIASPGTYTLSFRAKAIGQVLTTPNTITTPVTILLGVTSVNNPSAATSIGENEETDVELKVRHARSFSLAATGPADSILAALLEIPSVTDAFVAENVTAAEVDDVPAHGIWAIVDGATDDDVAAAIYAKKAPGCDMKGSVSVNVPKANGQVFTAKFDRPIEEDLYIIFTITPRRAGVSFDTELLKTQLVSMLSYKIAQPANIGDLVVAMLALAPDGILTEMGVSNDGMAYDQILATSDFQHRFALSVARIDITA